MATKILAAPLGEHMRRQAGRVGTDDSAWSQHLFYLCIEIMLDIQPLYHSFDDPVDIGQFFQVILDVAYAHQAGTSFAIECSRSCSESSLQARPRHLVAVFTGIRWHNIEHQAGDTDIGEMSSNGCSHHASAQYRCLTNLIRHGYDILSIIVATP